MTIHFHPRPVPTFAAFLVVALTCYLGYWQQGRAAGKRTLQNDYESRGAQVALRIPGDGLGDDLQFRRATAHGVWDSGRAIFVDNKFDSAQVGYHVVAPLKVSDRQYLLVNLGWIARERDYPVLPAVRLPQDAVDVSGILVTPAARFLELSSQTVQGAVWQNLTVERYRAATGLDVLPYVLLAAKSYVPLKPVMAIPDAGVEKHTEYMLTWYALAVTTVILWVVMNIDKSAAPSGTTSASPRREEV